jgi:chorismate dehydratase
MPVHRRHHDFEGGRMRDPIRVGAVNYLNTKPLIEDLTAFAPDIDLSLAVPSRLADRLADSELDVALIPVIEYFRAGTYSVVPGVSIATRGPVLSVTLFSKVPWEQIRSVALDEGSRTSAALAEILLRKKYNVAPRFEPLPLDAPADDLPTDAVLLIGDRAMRACLPGFRYAFDLGQEWADWTGLPMVYAVWAVRDGVNLGDAAAAFRRAKEHGLSRVGAIAHREAPGFALDAGFCRRYLANIIHYDLGPRELAGLHHYYTLAADLGLAPRGVNLVEYHQPHPVESR